MRLVAAASLGLLVMLALAATPARALPRLTKPAAGATLLAPVNGRVHVYRHRHAWGRGGGFYRNGFALMYYVHDYPRGISAKFGAPRCLCGCCR